jgi:hypothetical protein
MRIIGNAGKAREVQAVASGALSTGDTVVVNSDGTVSVVEETSLTQGFGSDVIYNDARTDQTALTYDPSNQKIVVFYQNNGNSSYGTASVGTVSGDSISFGTPVVFFSAGMSDPQATYDSVAGKVVVAYKKSAGGLAASVGTVSGTSITFGSSTQIDGDSLLNKLDCVYDVASEKVVIAYPDSGTSNHGKAVVGTVSGTSISFGTAVTFQSSTVININLAYDAASQKTVVVYTKTSNNRGTANVGTVSGTSISFGSAVEFETGSTQNLAVAYDASQEKVLIGFRDGNDSDQGKAVVGAVSGTSISFGTAAIFNAALTTQIRAAYNSSAQKVVFSYRDGSTAASAIPATISGTSVSFSTESTFNATHEPAGSAMVYDTAANRIVITYKDEGNSSYGTSLTMTLDETVTNLTSDNYIGTAATGAPSGQGAKINLKGAVDENQSGLTAGQSYYVQTDGTLGTTPADPSVFAGTAVAATKLIVKG